MEVGGIVYITPLPPNWSAPEALKPLNPRKKTIDREGAYC